ncbi:anoctamin-7-like [Eubalaena glacialis]|uniref:anoctamin-7-like n=1 Tax=Eubalaena glacialis TaxID=27606 RepID=UPI002A599894|nr:anoctamin-7-like [Eubalaena glacialis]
MRKGMQEPDLQRLLGRPPEPWGSLVPDMTPPPASTPCHETDLGEQCPEGGMGLRAQDKSELCGGKSPEAQAGRRRWRRGQGSEDDRLCASRGSIYVPDSGGNFFRDWKTEIDFLLVREEKLRPPRRAWWQRLLQRSWRGKFQRNLRAAGLLLEEECSLAKRRALAVYFAKLCALGAAGGGTEPARAAARRNPDSDGGGSYCGAFACCNLCSNTCPISSWTFRRSKLDLFLGRASHDSYFSSTQRHQVAEILARTIYGKQKRAEMVMARLLTEGVYTAAFPLREGPCDLPGYQEDFGDKVAIYFAWLVHLVLGGGDLCEQEFLPHVLTLCHMEWIFVTHGMDTCATWNISEICPMAKLGYLFDHLGTVFFSIFVSFWAMAFLEHWKHKSTTLAHHWDCSDFQEEELTPSSALQECPHPEFAALAPQMAQNPVTGLKEPYFPPRTRLPRLLTSSAAILIMLCVVMIFLVSVIIYCSIISIAMFHTANSVLMTQAGNIANISSTVLYLVLILLGQVYTSLAEQLTSEPGGCLLELAQQLFIITVSKQLVSNVQEFIVLKLKTWRQKRHLAGLLDTQIRQEQRRWEEDYELIEFKGQCDEHLEMVLQSRFITIFVAAFPPAPLFALLNNWVEIRPDTQKFCATPLQAFLIAFTSDFLPRLLYQDKGFRDAQRNLTLFYWKLLAVRLGFIIAFEHVVFFLGLIAWLVPDVPAALATKIKRERYLAKQALEDNREALLSLQPQSSQGVLEPWTVLEAGRSSLAEVGPHLAASNPILLPPVFPRPSLICVVGRLPVCDPPSQLGMGVGTTQR